MYIKKDQKNCEDVCFEAAHINNVVKEIQNNFDSYFLNFLETSAGTLISLEQFKALQQKFGISSPVTKTSFDYTKAYKDIFKKAIDSFEKDREKYIKLLDEKNLEDYQFDSSSFKSKALRNECPIIRSTLNANAKELENYKRAFNGAKPNELLLKVINLSNFAHSYKQNYYNANTYLDIISYKDLHFEILDSDECYYQGVLGGGIKSLFIYKLDPEVFPSRSRNAIWALYYLTNKAKFDCKEDSEFLNINLDLNITKQNYFYPYQLFSKYALEIFKLLNKKANELNVKLNSEYRYVIVDAFLDHVAFMHADEIKILSSEFREDGFDYGTMGY